MQIIETHNHNNIESDIYHAVNIDKFNRQCRIVFEQLMTGRSLTVETAMLNLRIMDLRRRVKTLRDNGIPVLDRRLKGGCKEYFLEESFIKNYIV